MIIYTAVDVEQSAPFGLLISNGEVHFFSWAESDEWYEVESDNSGNIRFVNCAYWDPCNQIVLKSG